MNFINHNGQLFTADGFSLPLNRATLYGDGLFETIRIHNGELLFLEDHLSRMVRGMAAMKMDVPDVFSTFFFHKQIQELVRAESESGNQLFNARIRISVYRSGAGLYEPLVNIPEYFIQATTLQTGYEWKTEPCTIDVFPDVPKNASSISFFKSMNALPGVMAAIYRRERNLCDCLLLNSHGFVADAISSNVFWIERGGLFSVPVSVGGVDGVMRINLIRLAQGMRFTFIERSITPDELKEVDEVFLTNVGWGIKAVSNFGEKKFGTAVTAELFNVLLRSLS